MRRVIEHRNIPLPQNWSDFLSIYENKSDLALFLSDALVKNAPQDKIIVTAGGLKREDDVDSNDTNLALDKLKACHEEADTRLVYMSFVAKKLVQLIV